MFKDPELDAVAQRILSNLSYLARTLNVGNSGSEDVLELLTDVDRRLDTLAVAVSEGTI